VRPRAQGRLTFADDGNRHELARAVEPGIAEAGEDAGVHAVGLRLAGERDRLGLRQRDVEIGLDGRRPVRQAGERDLRAATGGSLVFRAGLLRQDGGRQNRKQHPDAHRGPPKTAGFSSARFFVSVFITR